MAPCPDCGQTLIQRKNDHGILWDCDGCRRWLVGLPILRLTVETDFFNRLWQGVRNSGEGQGTACPSCSKPMNQITVTTSKTSLSPQVCKWCNVAWLTVEQRATLPLPPEPETVESKSEKTSYKKSPPEGSQGLTLQQVEQVAEKAKREHSFDTHYLPMWQKILALVGFPIVENDGAPIRFPKGTGLLVLATMGISLYSFFNQGLVKAFGFFPNECNRYGGLTFFSSFFIHAGWIHLLGNLYFLFVFGRMVEEKIGWLLFLTFIIFSTVSGNLLTLFLGPMEDIPPVGASGAISGILLFYGFTFPGKKIVFLMGVTVGFLRPRLVHLSAWIVFGLWVLLQISEVLLQSDGVRTISYSSHLGGAVAGLVYWLVIRWKDSLSAIKVQSPGVKEKKA